MEFGIVLIFFVLLFLIILIKGVVEDKRKIQKWQRTFREDFGKGNKRQWKSGELEQISHYSRDKQAEYEIDDLTWNDLDMDEVFRQMAYTRSSLGDDYLYDMLRKPVGNKAVLKHREMQIQSLKKQEECRIELQILFARLGRIQEYSFSDYLKYLMQEEPKSNTKHYLMMGAIVCSVLGMAYNVGWALAVFFGLIFYNMVMYFKDKAYLEPYLRSLRYLLKNLEYAKELKELLPTGWEEEKAKLQDILSVMKKMQKNSYLVMSSGRMAGEGLELILDYLRMCLHIDIIKFNSMLSYLQKYEKQIWELYEIMGKIDAYIAILEYRAFLPKTVCPEFHETKAVWMEEGYHPLIENAVSNSIEMSKSILLTGSNASGKSTFLKTMGINILLAQTIHTCAAERFSMPFCRLYTSMSLKDNLLLKESYYMAEIKAIKRILDAANEGNMVVCMVDEVLRGTNTVERIAASTQILKNLSEKKVLCIAATHDVELTRTLENDYNNYHFEEGMWQGDVSFSYQLKKGRATSCNAIHLLEYLGYNRDLIKKARQMVKKFEEQGEWICE